MKRLSIALTAMMLAACAAPTGNDQDGDVGETGGQDLAIGVTCIHSNMATSACQDTRNQVLAGAGDPSRKALLERAFAWIDAGVMYSQTSSHQGFRTDCSGYVSMAWEENTAFNTAGFAPFDTSVSKTLSGYSQLLPGDALNKVPREHMFLFGGWANGAHSEMIILEESHTGAPAMMKVVASSYFDSFRAIRSTKLGATNTSSASSDDSSDDSSSSSDTSSSGSCFSPTEGKEMPENACVQSSNGKWYQCSDGNWVDRFTDPTACNGTYAN